MINNNLTDSTNHNDNNTKITLKISAINVNSLRNVKRRIDLQKFANKYKLDLILVSETKLNPKYKISINNYNTYRTDRPNALNGGGTAIFSHNSLNTTEISYPNSKKNKCLEYTTIKIQLTSNKILYIFSIYANNNNTFIDELEDLFLKSKLQEPRVYYIIAGDFNARHTNWNDTLCNERGCKLQNWIETNHIRTKSTLINPLHPTYPSAKSYLDHCLIDSRLHITDLVNEKLLTLPYESDHNAITFTLNTQSMETRLAMPITPNARFNYKKTNWKKFEEYLQEHRDDYQIPQNRNLTIEEIDNNITALEEHIKKAISKVIPQTTYKQNNYFDKYTSHKIKKFRKIKSTLISKLFLLRNEPQNNFNKIQTTIIKNTIKEYNYLLTLEYKKTIKSYWESVHRKINYKDTKNFFPTINRLLRTKGFPEIADLQINKNNPIISHQLVEQNDNNIQDNHIYITDTITKLNIIGKNFENINSPTYTNIGTQTHFMATITATNVKNTIEENRNNAITITTFSENNPAHNPTYENTDRSPFHSAYEIASILKYCKNKTSSGFDSIPLIVLKHLTPKLINDLSTIINNAINHSYYQTTWKSAKVIPIRKKDKDPTDYTSYRPIS